MSGSESSQAEGKLAGPGPAANVNFRSLVDRSIQAWHSLDWVGQPQDRDLSITSHSSTLRKKNTINDLLYTRDYWFFQLRSAFMQQDRLTKWDVNRLDDYIVLPTDYGYVNNRNCYFVSHYWRKKDNPDPHGDDLRMFKEDLAGDEEWSYIWVDWTCMPQGDDKGARTYHEKRYFKMMLTRIPMLVRDCAFEWRFPPHEPRAWILYEVAEYILCHAHHTITDDNKLFINHVWEMVHHPVINGNVGVRPVLGKYNYKCTNDAGLDPVTGRLEILVIIARCFPTEIANRQDFMEILNKPAVGSVSNPLLDIEIDKSKGLVRHKGMVYNFTPIFSISSGVSVG